MRRQRSVKRVHVAATPGVVDHAYGPGARPDRGSTDVLVEVQGVGPDVGEDGPRAAQLEGIGGGDEGEGGQDDLVARLEAAEDGGHLQGAGAGGRHQGLAAAVRVSSQSWHGG